MAEDKWGREFIDFDEFSKGTGIKADNWIFKDAENSRFWKTIYHNQTYAYYLDKGNKVIHEFKYMKKYGEIWHRVFDYSVENPAWTMWSTWEVVD